ncbi:hypothetical protein DH2020_014679 [Rehmannia glutinosa]|uniref:Uncharacterized protein n=1 Tax=Rehmannia glutinosa TaxID=99300 RepID=A0ABR0X0M1_REHGL
MAAEHRKTFLKKYMEGCGMKLLGHDHVISVDVRHKTLVPIFCHSYSWQDCLATSSIKVMLSVSSKIQKTRSEQYAHLPPVLMDGMVDEVTLDEFKIFYGLDRELYTILVRDLCRNPSESLQIMGFWLWLERGGFCNLISKILSLRQFLINKISDEALTCLKLVNNQFPVSSGAPGFPLTQRLINSEISPQYFHENRRTIFHDLQNLVSDVYIPALSDIMEQARHGGFVKNPTRTQIPLPVQTRAPSIDELLAQSFSSLSVEGDASRSLDRVARANETMPKARSDHVPDILQGLPSD